MFILFCVLLAASFAFAETVEQALEFWKHYKPITDVDEDMCGVCAFYMEARFFNSEERSYGIKRLGDYKYVVSLVEWIDKAKPDDQSLSLPTARGELEKINDQEIRLEWLVDLTQRTVSPFNSLAQDCLNVFERKGKK